MERELQRIEKDPKYQQALDEIAALQEPVLRELSINITDTIKGFLPNVKQANVAIQQHDRQFALRGLSMITVDDGADTPLEAKGDGVQSLAALALMRHASLAQHEGKEVLIALEEPESHLHPNAIRQLRQVLIELSSNYQVVITTHNPLFANRLELARNIIVRKTQAYPARAIKDIRDVLGVHLDDNLASAEIVLIVEGEEDRVALTSILPRIDQIIKENMKSGRVAIDVLGGASNLGHRARLHAESVCKVHALLDDDLAGRKAFHLAEREGIINCASVNFTTVGGKDEAELEDLYQEDVYRKLLFEETGLEWIKRGADDKKKWTDRLRNLLRRAGKPYDQANVLAIKIKVARAAATFDGNPFHQSKFGPVQSLVNSLKHKLSAHR